jgi:multiple sugar transport system permease protein
VIALSMLPPIATVSPLFLMVNAAGLRDTLFALVAVYTGFALPLAVWLMTQFFRGIPDEIYIAARVDGCSATGAFVRVMLPLALPGLVATGLLVFVFAWNEFLYALTLTSSVAARTVPVGIALFPGLHEVPWGEIAAGSVAVTLPVVALAVVFQRRILDGLTAGAVKG